ncbi:MAG: hypothetical protein GF330_01130 [Candidatus Eisenbacteria bacterium]|nr:hypothetical protein [Candidatus Eisenbacteria bacterium]
MHMRTRFGLGALRRGTLLSKLAFLLGLLALLPGAKCPTIPEMEDVEVTVVAEDMIELVFEADGTVNVDSSVETLDIDQIRESLLDAGFDLTMIDDAVITDVLYGVVAFNEMDNNPPRWIRGNSVTVSWEHTPGGESDAAILFQDVDVEVYPLLGLLVPAPFEPGGIDFLNDLLIEILDDIRAPDLATEFRVQGSSEGVSEPIGRDTDFDWRIQIHFQIVGRAPVEVPQI